MIFSAAKHLDTSSCQGNKEKVLLEIYRISRNCQEGLVLWVKRAEGVFWSRRTLCLVYGKQSKSQLDQLLKSLVKNLLNSTIKSNWPLSLLVAELLLTLPVSEAVVQILFTLTIWAKRQQFKLLSAKRD